MIRKLLPFALLLVLPSFAAVAPPAGVAARPHCQVPCGIYGDTLRIDMLMEDAATIEKGMRTIVALSGADESDANQLVRWVLTKDQHAQSIQETVASYWLAQRIQAPADESEAARDAYHRRLALLHGLTVAAMKCKQTTDTAHVERLRELALEFSAGYFSKEDLEHVRQHHAGEHR